MSGIVTFFTGDLENAFVSGGVVFKGCVDRAVAEVEIVFQGSKIYFKGFAADGAFISYVNFVSLFVGSFESDFNLFLVFSKALCLMDKNTGLAVVFVSAVIFVGFCKNLYRHGKAKAKNKNYRNKFFDKIFHIFCSFPKKQLLKKSSFYGQLCFYVLNIRISCYSFCYISAFFLHFLKIK